MLFGFRSHQLSLTLTRLAYCGSPCSSSSSNNSSRDSKSSSDNNNNNSEENLRRRLYQAAITI